MSRSSERDNVNPSQLEDLRLLYISNHNNEKDSHQELRFDDDPSVPDCHMLDSDTNIILITNNSCHNNT